MSRERALDLLSRPGAWLDRVGDDWLIRIGQDRRRRPALKPAPEVVRGLSRDPGLTASAKGGWVLASRCADGPGRLIENPQPEVLINRGESPIAWLARRKGPDGRPWLEPALIMAAERLRDDFEQAGIAGRLTMDWDAGPRSRTARGAAPGPRDGRARHRVRVALAAVGPGLREMLEQVCLMGSALQAAERALGLPHRSGRERLILALDRLARHYRLI